jgi:hypothetical protein
MCHSIKVHKVIYWHPYVCCYITHLPCGYDILKPITQGEMLTGIRALADYVP